MIPKPGTCLVCEQPTTEALYCQNCKNSPRALNQVKVFAESLMDPEHMHEEIKDLIEMVKERDAELSKLNLQNERLQNKVAQLERFTECFVAHPYEGTLECDVTKPCPFCRYQSMNRLIDEAKKRADKAWRLFEHSEECPVSQETEDEERLANCECSTGEIEAILNILKGTERPKGPCNCYAIEGRAHLTDCPQYVKRMDERQI